MVEDVFDEDIEELDDEEEEEGGSSFIKYLILGAVTLLVVSGAVLGYLYFSSDDGQQAEVTAAASGDAGKKAQPEQQNVEPKAPIQYMPLAPAFVVNFSGDNQSRFLQVSLEVGARDGTVLDNIREHMPAIRNNLVLLFGSQDPDKLATREGKEKLREDLLAEIRAVLKAQGANSRLVGVYFTSFVMQ